MRIPVLVMMFAIAKGFGLAMDRLTAVEIPDTNFLAPLSLFIMLCLGGNAFEFAGDKDART